MTDNRNLLTLTPVKKPELEQWAQSRALPAGDVFRAPALRSPGGNTNSSAALYSGADSYGLLQKVKIYGPPPNGKRLEAGEGTARVNVSVQPSRSPGSWTSAALAQSATVSGQISLLIPGYLAYAIS